jgi:hypothetical protein
MFRKESEDERGFDGELNPAAHRKPLPKTSAWREL